MQDVLTSTTYDDDADDDDDNDPVWPTWVVGALFRGMRRIHIRQCVFAYPSVTEELGDPRYGQEAPR